MKEYMKPRDIFIEVVAWLGAVALYAAILTCAFALPFFKVFALLLVVHWLITTHAAKSRKSS